MPSRAKVMSDSCENYRITPRTKLPSDGCFFYLTEYNSKVIAVHNWHRTRFYVSSV